MASAACFHETSGFSLNLQILELVKTTVYNLSEA